MKTLAKAKYSDGLCRQVAQACDLRTAVWLARTAGVDRRLFLGPPTVRAEPGNMLSMLADILQLLPKGADREDCADHFFRAAADLLRGSPTKVSHAESD